MSQVEWIKIRVDMFDDEKIKLIQSMPDGDTLVVLWIRMLTLAGKINDNGWIYLREGTPYTPQMLSIIFGKPQPVVELALRTFSDFGMIENTEKGIRIVNWEKHQNVDGLERIRQQTRERVRKYREKKKQETPLLPQPESEQGGCNVTGNVTVTPGNAPDKEEERDKEIDKERDKKEREKENLSSKEDIESFVESQMASNPLPVNKKLLIKYIDCLRLKRKTARISKNIIKTHWEKWSKYPSSVITYAMWTHIEKHDDKPEEYTLAIMRNTDEHEANRKLMMLKNKNRAQFEEVNAHDEHSKLSGETPRRSKWEGFYIGG